MEDEQDQQPQQAPVMVAYPPQFYQPQGEEMYGARIPPRIRAAMAFIEFCAVKTMDRVVGENRVTGEPNEVPGQKLSVQEISARDIACKLLMRYFRGQLNPDFWETGQAIRCGLIHPSCSSDECDRPQRTKSEEIHEQASPEEVMEGTVQECRCLTEGKASPDCTICKGAGKVVCFPMKNKE